MPKPSTEELLRQLYDATISSMLERVKSGEATAADLNVARQMLKDNNISSTPAISPNLVKIAESLPFTQKGVDDMPEYKDEVA